MNPDDGFGPHQPELVQELKRSVFGSQAAEVKEGMVLNLNTEKEGKQHKVPALVTKISDTSITVDYNHPLAGQQVRYKLSLSKIGERKTNLAPTVPEN